MKKNDTHGLSDKDLTAKDLSYSPSSDRETVQLQAVEVGTAGVKSLPGTGGPDDAGDVEVDDEAIRAAIARRGVNPASRADG